jgi:hypothetical protein
LRVANTAPRERAIAAICASNWLIGAAGFAPLHGDRGTGVCSFAIEWQKAPGKILAENREDRRLEVAPAASIR